AHPSPVQGCYSRDNDYFHAYHAETKTARDYSGWRSKWVDGVTDRAEYLKVLGVSRAQSLRVKKPAFSAPVDYGY
ncbi:MAG TPA: hypothetical protein VG498_03675, partial [Terriglobales bacterium]|nr:hypothetical protein [Terriglobales bacterium]